MAMAQAPQQLYPARVFMRPVAIDLGSQAFTLGGAGVVFPLRQLGYLQALIVHITGTYTPTNAALVFLAFQPYNIVRNFNLVSPNSPLPPINAGGSSMHIWNLLESDFAPFRKGFRVPGSGKALDVTLGTTSVVGAPYNLDGNAFHDGIVDQMRVTTGAQRTLHLWWVLPFSVSQDDLRGILALGNSSITNLTVFPAAAADVVTVAANLVSPVFTVQVTQIYLTPPPAGAAIAGGGPPANWTLAFDETSQTVSAVGLQTVRIVPNYEIMGIQHRVQLNSLANSADVERLNLRINSSTLFQGLGLPPEVFDWITAGQQGVALPQGVFVYDQNVLGATDWIRTANGVTEIESDLTIVAGAAVPGTITTSLKRLVQM
jgi:hypothetical protein